MKRGDRMALAWERAMLRMADSWRRGGGLSGLALRQWRRSRRHPLTWASLYAAVIAVLGYQVIDRPLALALKDRVGGEFEGFLKTVTHLGLGAVWLIPSGVVLIGLGLAWRAAPTLDVRRRLEAIAWIPGYFFLAVASSGLINTLIKILVGRTRPKLLFEQGLYDFAPLTHAYATNSFPSGHSQAIFAAMTALALIIPRYDIAFVAVAVLVAATRVLTTVHFLSDAVMGAWLGAVVSVLLHRALTARGIRIRLRFERDRKLAD